MSTSWKLLLGDSLEWMNKTRLNTGQELQSNQGIRLDFILSVERAHPWLTSSRLNKRVK